MALFRFFSPVVVHARHGHRMRGKAPDIARSLNERLSEFFYVKIFLSNINFIY